MHGKRLMRFMRGVAFVVVCAIVTSVIPMTAFAANDGQAKAGAVPAAPQGVKAERISDEAIRVAWQPVREAASEENGAVAALSEEEAAPITYNVYRQFEGGGSQLIVVGLKEELLIKNADGSIGYQDMGEVAPYMGAASYWVSAVKTGVESGRSTAAKVVEQGGGVAVQSVTLSTQSGVTTFAKKNSTVTMLAKVAPATVENDEVTWSVANNGTDASISAAGVLSTGKDQGTITVKAVSKADGTTEGAIDIKLAYPTKYIETKEDDGSRAPEGGDSGVINPDFTFDPTNSTWQVALGEGYYGGTKSESSNVNAKLSYQFEGVGIAVYGQKHADFGALKVSIDGTEKGVFSMNDGSTSGTPRQMIASFYDLGEGTHTITISPAQLAGTSKTQANLDYFVAYTLNPNKIADKSSLQDAVEASLNAWVMGEDCYRASSWTTFAAAWAEAVKVMNANDATDQQVQDAVTNLYIAANSLIRIDPPALDLSNADFKALGIETGSLVLHWNKIDKAQEYNIYNGENLVGTTKQNYLRVASLSAGTEYEFKLEAKAQTGATGTAKVVVQTLSEADTRPKSAEITKVMRVDGGYQISWAGEEGQTYLVRVNGKAAMESPTADQTYTLANMTQDMQDAVEIIAITGENSATPTAAMLQYGAAEVASVPAINALSVARGTSFDTLKASLPPKAVVTLSDGHSAELSIEWQQGSYNGNEAKTYALEGNLTLGGLIGNAQNLKAAVSVAVQGTTPPEPTYTITATPNTLDFGSLPLGYTQPAAQTVTIKNTGNTSTTVTLPTAEGYAIAATGSNWNNGTVTLAANGTATFTAQPNAGLAEGSYNATLNIAAGSSTNATVSLTFGVKHGYTYNFTQGQNSAWEPNSGSGLTFAVDGDFANFKSVKIDGATLDASKYLAKKGSTVVTLNPEYLKALSAGKHTIEVVFTSNSTTTDFMVQTSSSSPASSGSASSGINSPATGDSGSFAPVLILLIGAAGIVLAILLPKRKSLKK